MLLHHARVRTLLIACALAAGCKSTSSSGASGTVFVSISFTASTGQIEESAEKAEVEAVLSISPAVPLQFAVVATLQVSGVGTATDGMDHSSPDQIIFPAGSVNGATGAATMFIYDDELFEGAGGESVHLYIRSVRAVGHRSPGVTFTTPTAQMHVLTITEADLRTARMSIGSAGEEANSFSFNPSISSDGRFVAFMSSASNLLPGDVNSHDCYVRDLVTGQLTLVNLTPAGTWSIGNSSYPAISGSGRYVAFHSYAFDLVEGDTNGVADIFVRDRQAGVTTRVSVSSLGEQGNAEALNFDISDNGRYIAFTSVATNMVPGDSNNFIDVFVHDRLTGQTTRESVSSAGVEPNDHVWSPTIDDHGRYVAYSTGADNLAFGDTNDHYDIFLRNRDTNETTILSTGLSGLQASSTSLWPSISGDGRQVAFFSAASNLVPGDTNSLSDIFVADTFHGTIERVSLDSAGAQGNGNPSLPAISRSGRYVTFVSEASNHVPGDTNGLADVFVHDRFAGETRRVSVNSSGAERNGTNDSFGLPAIADSNLAGVTVVFQANASNLVHGDTAGMFDIFAHFLGFL